MPQKQDATPRKQAHGSSVAALVITEVLLVTRCTSESYNKESSKGEQMLLLQHLLLSLVFFYSNP